METNRKCNFFDNRLIDFSKYEEKKSKFSDSSSLKVNTFWFLSLACGQNKTFEHVIMDFGKLIDIFFAIFWHFIDN